VTAEDVDSFSSHRSDAVDTTGWTPASTALLVIDMVNDFCTEGGAMVLPESDWLYPVINELAAGIRECGGLVLWIRDEHDEGDPEFRKRTRHCLSGSWGAQIVDSLTLERTDFVRPKHAFSAFYGTDLNEWLRRRGVTTLILSGVVTNICVRSTAHDAFFHGFMCGSRPMHAQGPAHGNTNRPCTTWTPTTRMSPPSPICWPEPGHE